jgi:large subunit ribosomal protein L21
MYAIIKTGGKQYRVAVGDLIDVELIEAELGGPVEFSEVLLVADGQNVQVGTPQVAGYVVKGELMDYIGGPKVHSMKYRKRKRSYKKWGHRQYYARVKIQSIQPAVAA